MRVTACERTRHPARPAGLGARVSRAAGCSPAERSRWTAATAVGPGLAGDRLRHAFTLVELIVVVAIISVVSALALPRLSRGATQAARAATQADWNLLQQQIDLFAEEHLGTFPASVADGGNAARTEAAFVAHLTQRTNMNGEVGTTAGHVYGP